MHTEERQRLSSGQRLGRGLKYTAVGPIDVTRGAVGIGVGSDRTSASWVGQRCRNGPRPAKCPRALLITGVAAAVLAGGAAAFVIVRRSSQPEPPALTPSVEVAPKP